MSKFKSRVYKPGATYATKILSDLGTKDCVTCGESAMVKETGYEYTTEEGDITLTLSEIWICEECGERVFTDASLTELMRAINEKEGTPYIDVKVIDGDVIKHTIH